jgi:hypothetical protein
LSVSYDCKKLGDEVKRELTPVFVQQEPDTHCTQHSLHYTADPATFKTSNKWNSKEMSNFSLQFSKQFQPFTFYVNSAQSAEIFLMKNGDK